MLFDILINEDNVFEENERFNIYINSVSNAHIVGIRQMARVTIIDNNSKYFVNCNMYLYFVRTVYLTILCM